MLGSPVNLSFVWNIVLAAYGLIRVCVCVEGEVRDRRERENCNNYTENVTHHST